MEPLSDERVQELIRAGFTPRAVETFYHSLGVPKIPSLKEGTIEELAKRWGIK